MALACCCLVWGFQEWDLIQGENRRVLVQCLLSVSQMVMGYSLTYCFPVFLSSFILKWIRQLCYPPHLPAVSWVQSQVLLSAQDALSELSVLAKCCGFVTPCVQWFLLCFGACTMSLPFWLCFTYSSKCHYLIIRWSIEINRLILYTWILSKSFWFTHISVSGFFSTFHSSWRKGVTKEKTHTAK